MRKNPTIQPYPFWRAIGILVTIMAITGLITTHAAAFVVNLSGDASDADLTDGVCDTNLVALLQQCTLRAAIEQANANAGLDTITFSILTLPLGAGVPAVIQPTTNLPTITDPLEIDGYTQPLSAQATATTPAVLKVILDGSNVPAGIGLLFETDDSRVRGLVVHSWETSGILVRGDRNTLRGNYVGTDESGTVALPNGEGISIGGSDNVIGGRSPARRNIISGNTSIGLMLSSAGNVVEGNFFGTDPTTTLDLGNGSTAPPGALNGAIVVEGPDNTIGAANPDAMNVIAGNSIGIHLRPNSNGTKVRGNHIGTDLDGTSASIGLGNGVGIYIDGNGTQIGSVQPDGRNIIANNISTGMEVWGDDNLVVGNYIGLDSAGTTVLPNGGNGIQVFGSRNQIGDVADGAANVISGNNHAGITVSYYENFATGNKVIPAANRILANLIGLDAAGTVGVGNGVDGILLFNATLTLIGGQDAGMGNIIAANGGDGVRIEKFGPNLAGGNILQGNVIGQDTVGNPMGNATSGVFVFEASTNYIGGIQDGAGNTIAHNGDDGVTVASGRMNAILGNAIFDNGLLGIDLEANGVTTNDLTDPDLGANDLQNFPVLLSAVNVAGSTEISGELNSTPNANFRLELFVSDACDASTHGEGQRFLEATTVTTNGAGDATGLVTITPALTSGQTLTATVTSVNGIGDFFNTSEFSVCITVP
ncbi:MAG: right-handed parallel beta-helix repeat-containing protein [Desulfosarcinaceae bacterium]|nr:right-handed parallel beta-helix repeat-containing protein [Desulfosarcinaceae bacterium]